VWEHERVDYSVVIASYLRPTLLRATVAGLAPMVGDNGEILVVEQAPAVDLSAEFARLPRVRHLVLPRPGAVPARNHGIRQARGDVVIFVDDDVIPQCGFIEAHLAPYRDPTVGGVAGRVLEAGKEPAEGIDPRALDPEDGWRYTHYDHPLRMDVTHAPSCNLSFRRSVLTAVGGFDPNFRLAWREDSDLCFRVRNAGHRLVFEPAAALLHLAASEGGTRAAPPAAGRVWQELLLYRKHFRHYRDNLYFLLKHFRGRKRWQWVLDAYVSYVGLSRWPWRLAAKNACFLLALVQAGCRASHVRPHPIEGADAVAVG
jgi:GT2 family glycosyltransferase